MAISVTNIGVATAASGSNAQITVGVGGVPSGALIAASTEHRANNASSGSIADTPTNTYTEIVGASLNATQTNGRGVLWYKENCAALSSGNTITYTPPASATNAISAFYATGIATSGSLDTAVTNSATGSSTTPSVTSGTPGVSGELFVAAVAQRGSSGTFTQDTTNSWAAPFNEASSGTANGDARINGGNQVNGGAGTITYAPSYTVTSPWAAFVAGFKASTTLNLLTLTGVGT